MMSAEDVKKEKEKEKEEKKRVGVDWFMENYCKCCSKKSGEKSFCGDLEQLGNCIEVEKLRVLERILVSVNRDVRVVLDE